MLALVQYGSSNLIDRIRSKLISLKIFKFDKGPLLKTVLVRCLEVFLFLTHEKNLRNFEGLIKLNQILKQDLRLW